MTLLGVRGLCPWWLEPFGHSCFSFSVSLFLFASKSKRKSEQRELWDTSVTLFPQYDGIINYPRVWDYDTSYCFLISTTNNFIPVRNDMSPPPRRWERKITVTPPINFNSPFTIHTAFCLTKNSHIKNLNKNLQTCKKLLF